MGTVLVMHVIVIGAGITGLSTALALAEDGHAVTVVDGADEVAAGASAQNGAQLSYAYVAPLAHPSTLRYLPKTLMQRGSPLKFRPGLSLAQWRWVGRFLRACTHQQAERTTHALLSLSALSRERFARWRTDAAIDPSAIDYARTGKLVLYRDQASWREAVAQVQLQASLGPPQVLCDAADCARLEPALAPSPDSAAFVEGLTGAVYSPDEEVADCRLVCLALAAHLRRLARVRLEPGVKASRWIVQQGAVAGLELAFQHEPGAFKRVTADAFVIAAGVGSTALAALLGHHVPITGLKGYSIEVPASCMARMPRVSVTDAARKVVFAPLGAGDSQRLRVAGMAELVGDDVRIDARRIAALLRSVEHVFGLCQQPIDVRPWCGMRPATPTSLPEVGPVPHHDNVFINAGQGALGFTLAFGSAAVLADCVKGRRAPVAAQGLLSSAALA
jgi:D-amino-acid dehydrogenase